MFLLTVEANTVFKDAKDNGISEITLNRAKGKLKIISRREGETGKKGAGKFICELPPADDLEVQKDLGYQEAHIEKNDTLNKNKYKTEMSCLDDDTLNPENQGKEIMTKWKW